MHAVELILAFAIAAFFAWIELVTSRYPRTIGLFWNRSKALWIYTVVYGLISLGFAAAYVPLTEAGVLRFQTFESSAPVDSAASHPTSTTEKSAAPVRAVGERKSPPGLTLLVAIMIGLSTKALLHIRLFSVPTAGTQQTFPVGTETIVQIFEPWLLRTILIDEFNAVSTYLNGKAARYTVLADVKTKILDNLPAANGFPQAERTALIADVQGAASVRSALEIYLRAFGVTTLGRRFP